MNTPRLEPSLPSAWYYGMDVFRTEKERIFFREWIAVCREQQLPHPGDHLLLDLCGESILLLRNREAGLRAFYNVCRHRGSRLCRTQAESAALGVRLPGGITGSLIVCPYHQWSYDFDGTLAPGNMQEHAFIRHKTDVRVMTAANSQYEHVISPSHDSCGSPRVRARGESPRYFRQCARTSVERSDCSSPALRRDEVDDSCL